MAKRKRAKQQTQKTFPPCWYECYDCKFKWEDYRILPKPDTDPVEYITEGGPGQTVCPNCKHDYVHWINYDEFAKWYRKNIGDGGCGGEPTH